MSMYKAYLIAVRVLITVGCLSICLIVALFSPCFIGANLISSTAFWRYFLVAVALSFIPIITVKYKLKGQS